MISSQNCFFDTRIMLMKLYSLKQCMTLPKELKISWALNTFVLSTAKLAGFPLITWHGIYIHLRANLPLPRLFSDVILLLKWTVSEGTVISLISIKKETWFSESEEAERFVPKTHEPECADGPRPLLHQVSKPESQDDSCCRSGKKKEWKSLKRCFSFNV